MHSKFFLFTLLCFLNMSLWSAKNCSDEPFDCGVIGYLAYPFWGGRRTSECGRRGFEIVCNANKIPIINISSLSYAVRKLDFITNTLTVARLDLQDTLCLHSPHNTTIDGDLFYYPPISTDRNITLYYNCTALQHLPNAFACANHTTSNLFHVSSSSGISNSNSSSCNNNIYVPVNKEDAQSLQNPTASSINILTSALAAGFSVHWFNDSRQGSIDYCNAKLYGSCGGPGATGSLTGWPSNGGPHPDHFEDTGPVPSPSPSPIPVHFEDAGPVPSPSPSPGPVHTEPAGNGNNRTRKIILAVLPLAVAGIIIASISIHCLLKRQHLVIGPNDESKHDVETILLQQGSLAPKRYRYSEIKKITKSFSDKLGQGGYGSVYKGMLPNGCPVAVKILIEIDSNGEEFINEVASISRTSHVNIVALLGFCYEGNKRALIYEFMPNSSLDKFLNHNQSHSLLDLERLHKIAVGIAKGLEYLHRGCNTRIVHFDIKPQNILLDEDFCPKISDFGLAKLYKKKQSILSVLGTRGTAGYIAPEVFSRNFGEVSHKSDVYSYGMMLLEMARGRKVDEVEMIQSSENYFPNKIYEKVISDVVNIVDLQMEGEEEERRRKMLVVGFWCIQTIPSNRPSISKVVEMLEGSLESIQIPPKPFLFSPELPMHEISSSLSACAETQNPAQY